MQEMNNWKRCIVVDIYSMIVGYAFTMVDVCFTTVDFIFTLIKYVLTLVHCNHTLREYKLILIENIISFSRIKPHFRRK